MRRYIFTFRKYGYMRFISHLDMQRLFKRSFRRAGVEPAYSKGFNPQPKINIVLPLSLGFETERDYLELDSEFDYGCEDLLARMNAVLPKGIEFTACRKAEATSKNLSAKVEFSEYEVEIPGLAAERAGELAEEFLSGGEIFVMKRDKKTKFPVRRSAEGMVEEFSSPIGNPEPATGTGSAPIDESGTDAASDPIGEPGADGESNRGAVFRLTLRTAANSSLNPKDFMSSFCERFGVDSPPEEWRIVRKDMYIKGPEGLVPLFDLED